MLRDSTGSERQNRADRERPADGQNGPNDIAQDRRRDNWANDLRRKPFQRLRPRQRFGGWSRFEIAEGSIIEDGVFGRLAAG